VIGLNVPIETPEMIKPYPPTHQHTEGNDSHEPEPDLDSPDTSKSIGTI
jgi:hypothetical protein